MLRKILLPTIFIILSYGFWISPNFKEIAAGVAIFLFGMLSLEEGFKAFAGGMLEKILKQSTDKLYKSISFGIVTTTLIQSSSLVSVLTISFLGAGLIGLAEGIGIIFGANIGTTTGAWLVAGFGLKVKISAYAMPMLVFGVILIFQKSKSLKGIGYILAGLGFLFLGIHYMKEGFEAFKNTIDLSEFAISGYKGLFIFAGIGIFATVVMQSSHATLVLIITALAAGQITYENALALAIGANIGTTITAILGSMSSNIDGKRLALAHLIFNVITGLIAIAFIHQLIWAVDNTSHVVGIANDDYTLKLALFHTFFNLIGVAVMIPFINQLVKFLTTTLSTKANEKSSIDYPRYLVNSAADFPDTAIEVLIKETKHLYENAFEIISHALNLKRSDILLGRDIKEIIYHSSGYEDTNIDELYKQKIKGIYGEIIDFATKSQSNMEQEDIQILYNIKLANRDIVEAIKATKHIQQNMFKYTQQLSNKYIKSEYNQIKENLALLLRNLNIISNTTEEDVIVLLLSKARINMEKIDIIANGKLDRLIRENFITNEMATSLMNDSAYAYQISKNLINMAETIFVKQSSNLSDIKDEILMDDEDVEQFLNKKGK